MSHSTQYRSITTPEPARGHYTQAIDQGLGEIRVTIMVTARVSYFGKEGVHAKLSLGLMCQGL